MGFWGRLIERIDKWAAPKPRCPWRVPGTDEQCIYGIGHRDACCTQFLRTNKRTGRQRVIPQYWAGINYDDKEN